MPNGDWRREDRIEVWLPHGVQADRQLVVNSVASGMTFALASRQFKLWPRHRWLGADVACDELGLLESCHRLLTTVFIKYCASFGGAKAQQRDQLLCLPAEPHRMMVENVHPEADVPVMADGPQHHDGVGDGAENHDHEGPSSSDDPNSFAAKMAEDRRIALQYVLS